MTAPKPRKATTPSPNATTESKSVKSRWQSRIVGEAHVAPSNLIPNLLNWRKHPKAQQVALSGALDEIGWIQRVIVNKRTGNIVDGHLRVELAVKQKEKTVPVCYVDLSPEEERIALATFDPLGALAVTDDKILAELLGSIETRNEDLSALLKKEDLSSFNKEKDEDEIPVAPKKAVTKKGDLWMLGDHRLLCGDCREPADMKKLFGTKRMSVAITSPPYAAQREYDESSGFKPIFPDAYVAWFDAVQENIASHMNDDGSFFLNIKEHCEDGQRVLYVKDLTLAHVRAWGWRLVDELIWTHGGTPKAVINRFKNAWEPIFHFTRSAKHKFRPERVRHASDNIPDFQGVHPSDENMQGVHDTKFNAGKARLTAAQKKIGSSTSANMQGDGKSSKLMSAVIAEAQSDAGGLAYPSNILSVGKNKEALGHSAAFPVGLPEFFVKAFSDQGDIVFDPFMGSGTTLVAAAKHERVAYGTELSPAYCDIIVARWENLTGKKALRMKR